MTGFRAKILAGAAALLAAWPAAAQEQPPESRDGDDIVVTGRAEQPPRRVVDRQARAISDITSNTRRRPLARMEDALCPGVIGLREDAATLMIDRIRWNAERLEMRMTEDDGTCTPNLIVAFVEDGKAQIAEMERKQPWMFRSLTLPERRALLAENGPVRVWTTAQTRTRDGAPVELNQGGPPPVASMWMAHSKIYLPIREDITQVLVLFDNDAVRGKTVIQLADYATMRSLARTKPVDDDSAALDTILTLFDADGSPPGGLTDFDQAYLRSVYDWIPNLPAATKLLGVNRQLTKVAEEAAARE